MIKCPTCLAPFKEPKWHELKGVSKRCYLGLKVKCINTSCNKTLDVTTFSYHDEVCELTFERCPDCDYKSQRGENSDHSCTKVLKNFYEAKLDQVKSDVRMEMRQFQEECLLEMRAMVRSERKRTEDLIVLCATIRKSFGDGYVPSKYSAFQDRVQKVATRNPKCDLNGALQTVVQEYRKQTGIE